MVAIIRNASLAQRTTLRMGGTAVAEVVVEDDGDLERLPAILAAEGGEPLVLGRGSNILAKEGALGVTLIRCARKGRPALAGEGEGLVRVRAAAGLALPGLLGFAAANGLSGLEPLAGIPGSVGGAVAMNAGSYGAAFGERLARLRVFTPDTGPIWIEPDGWSTGYRSFSLSWGEGFALVLEAEAALARKSPDEVRSAMKEHYAKKKETQPIFEATAGCVFKNPPGESAGRLLDQAGFKGMRLGNVAFSPMHANFLVNTGRGDDRGTADQALELMERARAAVSERFGVELEAEVKVVG